MSATRLTKLSVTTWAIALAVHTASAQPNLPPNGSIAVGTATIDELPLAAQNTIRGQAGSERVEKIQIVTREGRTNYHALFQNNGKATEVWVDAGGRLLRDSGRTNAAPARLPLSAVSKVTLKDLPDAVRAGLLRYASESAIEDIEKGTLQGRTVHEVTWRRQGQKIALRFEQNGELVPDDLDSQFLAEQKSSPAIGKTALLEAGKAAGPQAGTGAGASEFGLPTGLKPISFGKLPYPVLSTIQAQAGAEPLATLEQGNLNGRTIYQATYEHEGSHVQLQIADDGTILTAPIVRVISPAAVSENTPK